ncbi:GON-4-like protein [Aplochiton taeniatus]
MMKTAIENTQDMPMFEPKMTRSRLKQVVEKGEANPSWDVSPIKMANKVKPPQFVDIPLEDEEDSSDEEYCPDDDEEDETAEDTFLESDVDSTASSPRVPRGFLHRTPVRYSESEEDRIYCPKQKPKCSRHQRVEAVPMDPPPPPSSPRDAPDSSFMERLCAVEEELALNCMCQPYQPIGGEGASNGRTGLVSCRTRSKRPLRDIPLGKLEAELRAPDVTSDMYDLTPKEDHHWSQWLQSLMTSDGENEEGDDDDDDDPEYNFLEDLVEPDREDYRTDKAVQITKKEVNELLEELFDTFQDELGLSELDEDRLEGDEEREEEAAPSSVSKFYVPQAIRFDAPLASMLTERRRAVREQYEALQQRRALQDTPGHGSPLAPDSSCGSSPESSSSPAPIVLVQPQLCPALTFNHTQKLQLQQQIQQHVQLLTQVHLLCSTVKALHHEACTTKQYLEELGQFARRQEESHRARRPRFNSSFRACNLQGSLELLLEQQPYRMETQGTFTHPPRTRNGVGTRAYALLPQDTAWLLATRPVFLYPELLPHCSLDPALHPPRSRILYTSGEEWLIAMGLKHFQDTELPYQLMCNHLVRNKKQEHLRNHVKDMSPPNAFNIQVPQPTISQRVILLGKASSTPVQGALTLVQIAISPNQKAVPTTAKDPIDVSQKALVQMSTGTPTGTPLVGQAVLPVCVMQTLANQISTPYIATCKHPCIRQAPPKGHVSLPNNQDMSLGCVQNRSRWIPLPNLRPQVSRPFSHRRALTRPLLPAPPWRDSAIECTPTPLPVSHQKKPGQFHNRSIPDRTDYVLVQMANQTLWVPKSCLVPSTSVSQINSLPALTTKFPDQVPSPTPVTPSCPFPYFSSYGPSEEQRTLGARLTSDGAWHADTPGGSLEEQLHWLVEVLQHGKESEREGWGVSEAPLLPNSCSSSSQDSENIVGGEDELVHKRLNEMGKPEKMEGEKDVEKWCLVNKSPVSFHSLSEGVSGGGDDKSDGEEREEEENYLKGMVMMSKETIGGERHGGMEPGGEGGGGGEDERNQDGGNDKLGQEGKENSKGDGEEGGQREKGHGGEKDVEGDKDRDPDRQGEEEDEEDFDELTQDEDEEEVMSSASEESVLSVPELQETMKKLTWLASERRLCPEGDSEEDHSPNSLTSPTSPNSPVSQNSQEENSEEEEEGPAKEEGLESGEGRASKVVGDEHASVEGGRRRVVGKGAGRGRGRARPPPRNLKRSRRQERDSKDASKLLLLYDDRILDNDPQRESKDVAFAQAYLNRVREALKPSPGRLEEFLGLLYEFEQGTEGRSVVELFRQLRSLLDGQPELTKDFAAFLLPEQALECGLLEEQQAFEQSRRFLRQLEISFGGNPTHYQKIVKALQVGPVLSPSSIEELKTQMSSLLKGHTHLQGEFGVFFDDMRPPPARPGQFEEAVWPEEGGGVVEGVEGVSWGSGGGIHSGFEEVTLPDLEEEDEGHKIRSRRRKIDSHGNYKECDWTEKDCSCLAFDSTQDVKLRRHKRKGCCRCNCHKPAEATSRTIKSLDPIQSIETSPTHDLHTEVCSKENEKEEKEDVKEEEKESERLEEKEMDSDFTKEDTVITYAMLLGRAHSLLLKTGRRKRTP